MKIGIMTFPNSTSFGAVLQMYALYHAVEELGAEVEIVNYHNAYMKAERHTGAIQQSNAVNKKLRLWARRLLHNRQIKRFRTFEKTMTLYPGHPISDPKELQKLSGRYDGVICGSDQVWNPNITDSDLSYFLDFCEDEVKRISYAPSFGITKFSESFQNRIRKELEQFRHLSVREVEGQQLLQQLMGQEIPLVLDPTFLLKKDAWQMLEQKHPAAKEEYILYYTVSKSKSLFEFCLELAEKEKKKVVIVGGNAIRQLCNKNKRVEYAWDLSPGEWLYLIHNAWCVVTNSFHGTAFSLHYQKDFFLEFSSETNSRLEQIIRTTGLENRVVYSGRAPEEGQINYTQVERNLARARALSHSYLKESIQ